MPQLPFQVVCTSCESALEVRNSELIGQIVACPKCGSMVMIAAPQQPVPVPEPPAAKPPRKKAAKKTLEPKAEKTVEPKTKKASTKTVSTRKKKTDPVAPLPNDDVTLDPVTVDATTDGTSIDLTTDTTFDAVTDDAEPVAGDDSSAMADAGLGPLASELQAKYLADASFDDWQKRRLAIVAIGLCCLLVVFVAFLLLMPEPKPVVDHKPVVTEPSNVPTPLPPGGTEKTRTSDQTSGTVQEITLGTTIAQGTGLPLPPADQIKVAFPDDGGGQTVTESPVTDETGLQTTGVSISPSNAEHVKPVAPDTTAGTTRPNVVRVGPSLQGDIFIDPFGDIFDREESGNGTPNESGRNDNTPDGTETTTFGDGFSDILRDHTTDANPSGRDPNVPDQTANVTEIDESGMTSFDTGVDTQYAAGHATENERLVTRPDVGVEPGDIEGTVDSLKQTIAMSAERQTININERLQLPVVSMRFEKAAIIDIVRAISDASGVPIQLALDELRARGISVESPVSLQLQETTLAGVIEAVMQKTRLTQLDGSNHIVFGYTDEQNSAARTVHYDMSQLASLEQDPISTEQASQWLSELLLNQPQNSRTSDAAVAVDGNEIVVVGSIWLQDQARRLLLSLFYMRNIEPETKLSPERLAPEVFGWDRVNTPLSFNLVEPMPLKKATRLIEQHTKLRLLIDHAALHDEGLSQETLVISHVSNGTVDTVLREMLEPLGLTYRIVEANAVEITSPIAARSKMTIEAQHYAPLLTAEKTPESIAETMRQVFGGNARWGGETGGAIVIDAVSGYMLVRQSQPLQRDIRLWFGHQHLPEEQADEIVEDEIGTDITDDDSFDVDDDNVGVDTIDDAGEL